MANQYKGEVSAEIDGTTYTLRIATNEWCELEDEFDKPTTEIVKDFFDMVTSGTLRMKTLRSYFRAALSGSMQDIDHQSAGTIMSNMGLVDAAALLGRVIVASMPDASENDNTAKEDGKTRSRPRKAAKA